MKQLYETIFIITPLLTEEQMKEVAGKFRDYLVNNQAEIEHEENWGLRKLAYPIRKKSTGFYQLFEFRADPDMIAKMDVEFRRDERIMRFQTVKEDKYMEEFNQRRRRGEFKRVETVDQSVQNDRKKVSEDAEKDNDKQKA